MLLSLNYYNQYQSQSFYYEHLHFIYWDIRFTKMFVKPKLKVVGFALNCLANFLVSIKMEVIKTWGIN